jgi:protein deglycase
MIYVFFAPGFEEIEGLTAVDILRRAKLDVAAIGVGSKEVTGSHAIEIICDYEIGQVKPDDSLEAVILPGGMPGTLNLDKSPEVQAFIDYAYQNNKLLCAICAAPIILGRKKLLCEREAVCFPGFEDELKGAKLSKKYVCRDGYIITAKGMGVSIDFAIEIAKAFIGDRAAIELKESLQCQ